MWTDLSTRIRTYMFFFFTEHDSNIDNLSENTVYRIDCGVKIASDTESCAEEWILIEILIFSGIVNTYFVNLKTVISYNSIQFIYKAIGASNSPCSDSYAGPNAFSEPETKSLSSFIEVFSKRIKFYLSFHAFGQFLVYPYGNGSIRPDNSDILVRIFLSII